MCGIAGWVDWEIDISEQAQVLEAMSEVLACRGPDASGMWLSPRAGLTHRRLVVVDPQGGGQPMFGRQGEATFVITYNGELYNTEELRTELQLKGHQFLSYSDTEVLLKAYMQWGPGCLERLNGIFAFGIWSEKDQSLFLARDRLGVKPLFYAQRGPGLIFASELKGLLAHPAIEPRVGAEGLSEVLLMGPGRTPGHGIFQGVHELKPGHWLLFTRSGITGPRRYWALTSKPHTDGLEATTARLRELLQDAVQRQLVSDVPVCTLLSGGLDSSAVTAFAASAYRAQGRTLSTFSIDYRGNEGFFQASDFQPDPDGPWVTEVSRFLATNHHQVTIDTPALVQALEVAVRARDLPGMADIDSSLYLFSREIKRQATVALSGEAADEILGGYPWFRRLEDINARTFPWMRMGEWRLDLLSPEVKSWMQPQTYLQERYREALAEVPCLSEESPKETRMRQLLYLSITRFLPTLLDRKDRMSMAVGLEVRVPYCDHRLVEYVWNIPWEMKAYGGQLKGILRQALKGVLPQEVLARPKSPYPKTHHPEYLEAVRDWLLCILADPTSPLHGLINGPSVRRLAWSGADQIDLPWYGQLMTGPQMLAYLIQVDIWLRKYRVSIG